MKGIVASTSLYGAVIEVGGIGYELSMSSKALAELPPVGGVAQVYTYLQVKEDGLALFGFSSLRERELFSELIGVSGVGPKMALSALSTYDPSELAQAIASGDITRISKVPGIGKKRAQRIVLELKGVLEEEPAGSNGAAIAPGSAMADASQALEGMGFSADEVSQALSGCSESEPAAIIRYALKNLGGGA
ncbi:MAG: Holliday junction branch migration protein RuvA [Coriobacteriales bacterium]|jgi:Holliday junction DNA helicase RuvA